jgi:hypothetical protein
MSIEAKRRWCIFTSAGDRNVISRWLEGDTPQRWDLVVAYYGDNEHTFAEISKLSSYAFLSKGGKFQNLKRLVLEHPKFFDHYSHVWVCDDDIVMSTAQINTAFKLTEALGFWVAQPATRAEGKNSHWITCFAGPQWDYRIVNFVEIGLPIFRRDKLIQFLTVYDGSLMGWGIDYWYANFFEANEFGRFAVFDKIQVVNPRNQDKGGSEIDQLQTARLREADWNAVRQKFGLIEYPHKIFAYCRLAPAGGLLSVIEPIEKPPAWLQTLQRSRYPGLVRFAKAGLLIKNLLMARCSGWHDAIFLLSCRLSVRRQRRATGHGFEI